MVSGLAAEEWPAAAGRALDAWSAGALDPRSAKIGALGHHGTPERSVNFKAFAENGLEYIHAFCRAVWYNTAD